MDDAFAIDGVDELFGVPLEEFIAARDALVKALKADKRKEDAATVKALRKPSAAAYAINQVARSSSDDVDALLAAGAAVREAQAKAMQGRDDGALRTTTREWRDRVNGLAARAGQHRDDAAVAFEAASVDEVVGAFVRAGRLTAVPEAGGLGGLAGMPERVVRTREPEPEAELLWGTPEPEPVDEAPMEPAVDSELEAKIAEAEKELEKRTHRLRRAEQRLDQAKQEVREAEAARDEAAKNLRRIIG